MNRMLIRVWVLAVPLVAGCATMQKDAFIKEQAGDYAYAMPVAQVWPHVGAMLKEPGYTYREAPGRFLLVTEWKEENGASSIAASFSRYMVEGQPIDDEHCRVRFIRNTMTSQSAGGDAVLSSQQRQASQATGGRSIGAPSEGGGPEGSASAEGATATIQSGSMGRTGTAAAGVRDLNAEWLLMQRVAPEDAKEIQDEADHRFR